MKIRNILIKNIYYMLAYAFQFLNHPIHKEIAQEKFEHIENLFAALLVKSISKQLKQSLHKEYTCKHENLHTLKGKLDLHETINNKIRHKTAISCEYDELSENNIYNQIVKTTVFTLIRSNSIKDCHRKALKKIMMYFSNVSLIDPICIKWNKIRYNQNNQTYRMLINICCFVLSGIIFSTQKGRHKIVTFWSNDQIFKILPQLFEKFVLEYYKKHFPFLHPSPMQIPWYTNKGSSRRLLPIMQTDITLENGKKTLIIDTKCYKSILNENFNAETIFSNNLYQIFSYVKNKDFKRTGSVAGMLLYAQTENEKVDSTDFTISGNDFSIRTLNLNTEFNNISDQLDKIATNYFGWQRCE